jgi:cytochrome P450
MAERGFFPIGAAISLTELEGDPHPALHRLRESEPVSWLPALSGWLVTRRVEAIQVMRDAATYTVDHPGFSTAQVVGASMLSLDGAEHQRHRKPFERPFRMEAVQARLRSAVEQHVRQQLAGFAKRGRAELRREFAGPVAVQTMISVLGLEGTGVGEVLGWYDDIVGAVTRVTAGEPVSAAGRAAFGALRESLKPALERGPDASLLAAAGGMAEGLSVDQVVSNAAVLLFGGIETTEGMLANALFYLLTLPELYEQAHAEPALLPAIVEESLRLEPAAAVVDRYATRDVELSGAAIRAGDLVRVSLSAANRDPLSFPDPDRFDPARPHLRAHLTFAQGPHVCLGLHLARLEAHLALEMALTTLPDLRLHPSEEARKAARPRGLVFRKPQALRVIWRV